MDRRTVLLTVAALVLAGASAAVVATGTLRRVVLGPPKVAVQERVIDALSPVAVVAPVRRVRPVTPPLPDDIAAAGDAEAPNFAPATAPAPERNAVAVARSRPNPTAAVATSDPPRDTAEGAVRAATAADGRIDAQSHVPSPRRVWRGDFPAPYGLGAGRGGR